MWSAAATASQSMSSSVYARLAPRRWKAGRSPFGLIGNTDIDVGTAGLRTHGPGIDADTAQQ
jgi:hypothetical protein